MGISRWSLTKQKVFKRSSGRFVFNNTCFPNFAIYWRGKPRGFYLCLAHGLRWSRWWK